MSPGKISNSTNNHQQANVSAVSSTTMKFVGTTSGSLSPDLTSSGLVTRGLENGLEDQQTLESSYLKHTLRQLFDWRNGNVQDNTSLVLIAFSIASMLILVLGLSLLLLRRHRRGSEMAKKRLSTDSKITTFGTCSGGYRWALRRKSSRFLIDIDKFVDDLKRSSEIASATARDNDLEAGEKKKKKRATFGEDNIRKLSSSFWTLRLNRSNVFQSFEDDEANSIERDDFTQFNHSLSTDLEKCCNLPPKVPTTFTSGDPNLTEVTNKVEEVKPSHQVLETDEENVLYSNQYQQPQSKYKVSKIKVVKAKIRKARAPLARSRPVVEE